MLFAERVVVLDLLRKHPGWSDARVVEHLERKGLRASVSSIQRWREEAGLAPFTKNVQAYPAPRVPGVLLTCGHLIHPEAVSLNPDLNPQLGYCVYCGRNSPTVRR